jgi:hypothetical protein
VEPTYALSEKSWVKQKQKGARALKKRFTKYPAATNRAIVAGEKLRTAEVRAIRKVSDELLVTPRLLPPPP